MFVSIPQLADNCIDQCYSETKRGTVSILIIRCIKLLAHRTAGILLCGVRGMCFTEVHKRKKRTSCKASYYVLHRYMSSYVTALEFQGLVTFEAYCTNLLFFLFLLLFLLFLL